MSAGNDRSLEQTVRDSYESVPYQSGSIHSSHPDNLATRALLFGLEPPDLRRVRVLELGCADGGNLIPMASELPEGRFLGIDLSPRQIEDGRRRLETLGIANVELRAISLLDVCDIDASLGEFDYIIAHGLFSWVRPEVQDAILRICRQSLAPWGVAYVSYNTLPGWHQRMMVREIMTFYTRGLPDLREKAETGLGVLELLTEAAAGDESHARFLRSRFEHLAGYREQPSYIVHEYLEESNEPLYFHDFMARASHHQLQYVADAETGLAEIESLKPAIADRLRAVARDRIGIEQSLDFIVNRVFRRSLLCHEGVSLELSPIPEQLPERMRRFHAVSPVRPESAAPDVRSGAGETFRGEPNRTFTVSHPPTKALLMTLAETWPRPLAFDDLRARVAGLLGGEIEEDLLADMLFSLYCGGFLDLHLLPPLCTERVSERPQASPLARREATLGPQVTSQHRRILRLDDELARVLLLHLDGTRDRAALRDLLAQEVQEGRLGIEKDDKPVRDPGQLAPLLDALVEQNLRKMAGLALLVA